MASELSDRRLRASDAFTLRGFDELEPREQDLLVAQRSDPDFFGVLVPKAPSLPWKSVSKEAALLLLTLRQAHRIPRLLEGTFGGDLAPLDALIADGVIE